MRNRYIKEIVIFIRGRRLPLSNFFVTASHSLRYGALIEFKYRSLWRVVGHIYISIKSTQHAKPARTDFYDTLKYEKIFQRSNARIVPSLKILISKFDAPWFVRFFLSNNDIPIFFKYRLPIFSSFFLFVSDHRLQTIGSVQ